MSYPIPMFDQPVEARMESALLQYRERNRPVEYHITSGHHHSVQLYTGEDHPDRGAGDVPGTYVIQATVRTDGGPATVWAMSEFDCFTLSVGEIIDKLTAKETDPKA